MEKHLVVSVVVPVRNAEAFLIGALQDLARVLGGAYRFYEIIVVDDASEDGTGRVMARALEGLENVRFVRLARSYGREIATAAGLESAIGDFVVTLDLATDPPELIPELVERCRLGSGVLCGVSAEGKKESKLAAWASRVFHGYCRRFLGFDYRENATEFRVLSRQVVNAVTRIRDRRRYLRVFTARLGFPQDWFSYTPRPGPGARAGLWERMGHGLEIAIAHSRHPLRLVSGLGLAVSGLNALYAVYVVLIYLFKPDVAEGWTTLSLQMTGMFFFLFLILAVMCEYVGRILEETQERPLYLVASEQTSSVVLENSVRANILNEARG